MQSWRRTERHLSDHPRAAAAAAAAAQSAVELKRLRLVPTSGEADEAVYLAGEVGNSVLNFEGP